MNKRKETYRNIALYKLIIITYYTHCHLVYILDVIRAFIRR